MTLREILEMAISSLEKDLENVKEEEISDPAFFGKTGAIEAYKDLERGHIKRKIKKYKNLLNIPEIDMSDADLKHRIKELTEKLKETEIKEKILRTQLKLIDEIKKLPSGRKP